MMAIKCLKIKNPAQPCQANGKEVGREDLEWEGPSVVLVGCPIRTQKRRGGGSEREADLLRGR